MTECTDLFAFCCFRLRHPSYCVECCFSLCFKIRDAVNSPGNKNYKLHHVLLTRYRRYMDGFLNDIFGCSSAYVLAVAHTARSCVSPEYAGVKTMNMRVRIGTSFVCVSFAVL